MKSLQQTLNERLNPSGANDESGIKIDLNFDIQSNLVKKYNCYFVKYDLSFISHLNKEIYDDLAQYDGPKFRFVKNDAVLRLAGDGDDLSKIDWTKIFDEDSKKVKIRLVIDGPICNTELIDKLQKVLNINSIALQSVTRVEDYKFLSYPINIRMIKPIADKCLRVLVKNDKLEIG